jgi:UDP-glucose-4-epimerase GalE
MRVLVTGGAGYIGNHAARLLRHQSHHVRILDNLSTGHTFLASDFDFVVGDISDADTVAQALVGMDAVMHFAASAYVGESVRDPRRYFDNNVRAALVLLNAVIDSHVNKFVFSSSCAVYGLSGGGLISEATPREPVSPYGATKLSFEHALSAYDAAYGLRSVALRYFNVVGAEETGAAGELHEPETHLVPLALRASSQSGSVLQVFGADYPTPDGTCIRDYVDVNDIAQAHVLALEYLAAGGNSETLNLGTGVGYSVQQIIRVVEKTTGKSVRYQSEPRRAGDPPILIADYSRAFQILKWKPVRTIEESVHSAWRWMQVIQSNPT